MSSQDRTQTSSANATQSGSMPVHSLFSFEKHVDFDGEILDHRAGGLLIVSIHAGSDPALVIMEMNPVARLNVYDAKCESTMPAEKFGLEVVIPLLKERHAKSFGMRHFVLLVPTDPNFGDLVNAWANQFRNIMGEFNEQIRPIDSSTQLQGLDAADRFMRAPVGISLDNMPKLLICQKYANKLINALADGYIYAKDDQGRLIPNNTSDFGRLAIAFHYGCLFAERRGPYAATDNRTDPVAIDHPTGWT